MAALRNLLCLVIGFALAHSLPAAAQLSPQLPVVEVTSGTLSHLPSVGRTYLGLNVGRSRYNVPCGSTSLLCDDTATSTEFYAGRMIGNFWGLELAYLNAGPVQRLGGDLKAQGLNLSVIGRAPLGHAIGLFGKVGTTYGRTENPALAGNPNEQGFGLAYGAGVSLDFTPRLSATFELESNDFRFAGTGRDAVRSANLGLRYRY
ncbi:MAG: outer membrane beta-barrel protein [Ramlibacter sp.]